MSQVEALAKVIKEWGKAAGLELGVVPRAGAEVRIGAAEWQPGYIIPPPVEGEPPPEPVVVSGVEVEGGYFVARRPEGALVAFRRGEDGMLHRCETGAAHVVVGRLLCRVAFDRARAKRDALMPLLELLGPPGEWEHPLPPNPVVNQPKKVLTPEEKAAKKAAKKAQPGNGVVMEPVSTVITAPPVAKTTPGPKKPGGGPPPPKPKPSPPKPQPSPSAALNALAARVKAREAAKV